MCVSSFWPLRYSPLTALNLGTQRSWHVRAQSGKILCESASLRLLSKLNGEDVLFIYGEFPCDIGPTGKQEVCEVFSMPATWQVVEIPSSADGTQEKACSICSHA